MSYFQRLIMILTALLVLSQITVSQTVPVKFHFQPTFTDFQIDQFTEFYFVLLCNCQEVGFAAGGQDVMTGSLQQPRSHRSFCDSEQSSRSDPDY